MKFIKQTIAVFVIACATFHSAFSQEFANNRLILKLKQGVEIKNQILKNGVALTGVESLDQLQKRFKCVAVKSLHQSAKKRGNTIGKPNLVFLAFEKVENFQALKEAYQANEWVIYAEPDFVGTGGGKRSEEALPNDALLSRQWGIKNDGSFSLAPRAAKAGADIKIESVWSTVQGDPSNIIAILDSGVKPDHPEYEGRIWQNSGETPNDGIDNDGNGLIDDFQGWNYADDNNKIDDNHGHGSNVTSIAAATGNNSLGYAGVDWKSTIMVCKVLDQENKGFYSWWIAGITYAVDNGAKVINLSLGGSSFSQSLQEAIQYAYQNDVFVVVCMMNENTSEPYYPAAYEASFAVGAVDPDDRRSNPFFWSDQSGSNFGSHISVVAPGNYIYGLSNQDTESYSFYWGGTSQAAPYVAGVASLLRVAQPQLTVAEIAKAIEDSADDLVGFGAEDTPGFDIYHGHGRLNAAALFNLFSVTALEEDVKISEDIHLMLYPNPAQNSFQLNGLEKLNVRATQVILYSLEGKKLAFWEVNKNESRQTLNLPQLPVGQYIIRIENEVLQKNLSLQIQ